MKDSINKHSAQIMSHNIFFAKSVEISKLNQVKQRNDELAIPLMKELSQYGTLSLSLICKITWRYKVVMIP